MTTKNNIRSRFLILVFACSVIVSGICCTGCRNIFDSIMGSDDADSSSSQETATSGITVSFSDSSASRSAYPEISTASTTGIVSFYGALVSSGSTPSSLTEMTVTSSGSYVFSFNCGSYSEGDYTLYVYGFKSGIISSTATIAAASAVATADITLSHDTQFYAVSLVLGPNTANTSDSNQGSISLNITYNSSLFTGITATLDGTAYTGTYDTSSSTLTFSNVSSGTYSLVLLFTKSSQTVYSRVETVAVWPGCTTNKWHLTSGTTDTLTVTSSDIYSTFFVRGSSGSFYDGNHTAWSASDTSNTGGVADPFVSVQTAVNKITAAGVSSATVYIDGTVSYSSAATNGTSGMVDIESSSTQSITIRSISSSANAVIDAGSTSSVRVMYISGSALTVTLQNITLQNGDTSLTGSGVDLNAGSLAISGNTVIGSSNTVYLNSTKISIPSALTSTETTVAVIVPASYTSTTTQLLSGDGVASSYGKFSIQDTECSVTSTGYLSVPTTYLTSAPTSGTCTCADSTSLAKIATWVNASSTLSGVTVKLNSDISLSGSWTAIGDKSTSKAFEGILDGNGKTISGLNADSTSGSYPSALIGYLSGDGGSIKNLTVEGTSKGAGIVGYMDNGTVENCISKVVVEAPGGQKGTGGIVGSLKSGTITGCKNEGKITLTDSNNATYAGGIFGDGGGSGISDKYTYTVTNCINTAAITGPRYVGGIGGRCESTVQNCFNTGSITATISHVGGILGEAARSTTVTNCGNTGTVTGTSSGYIGGIIGFIQNKTTQLQIEYSTIKNCYSSGTVSGSSSYIGGIAGNDITGNIVYNYYLSGTSSYGIGGTSSDTDAQTNTFTSLNSVCTTATSLTVGSYTGTDVLELLNAWVTANGSTTYTSWVYSSGLPVFSSN